MIEPGETRRRVGWALGAPARDQAMRAYVALGDSFTAGTGCPPGEGWADRLAAALAARPTTRVREPRRATGRPAPTCAPSSAARCSCEPDLVTVVCGTNDVLYARLDPLAYARNLSAILTGSPGRVPGVRVVTATAPERWDFLPLGPADRGPGSRLAWSV